MTKPGPKVSERETRKKRRKKDRYGYCDIHRNEETDHGYCHSCMATPDDVPDRRTQAGRLTDISARANTGHGFGPEEMLFVLRLLRSRPPLSPKDKKDEADRKLGAMVRGIPKGSSLIRDHKGIWLFHKHGEAGAGPTALLPETTLRDGMREWRRKEILRSASLPRHRRGKKAAIARKGKGK